MTDNEKFEGLKKNLIKENDEKYGEEIRSKYGQEQIERSNAKMMKLTETEYKKMQDLDIQIKQKLKEAVRTKQNPEGEAGKEIAELHKEWLMFTLPWYTKETHNGLVEMYLADQRFQNYYDNEENGCTEFLKKAVLCVNEKA